MAGGRPKWAVTAEIKEKAEQLAAQGLTLEQIAKCLGISYQTLNERRKENAEFAEVIKRGQAKGIAVVTNALFQSAKGGNVTAQIFYLKNRAADEWKDRKDIDVTSEVTERVTVINANPDITAEEWLKKHRPSAGSRSPDPKPH